jgi:hypothetical protein
MGFKCSLGLHDWAGCKCPVCGKTRDKAHDWSADCAKCRKCGKPRTTDHTWAGCKCSACGKTRDKEHAWVGCECSACDRTRDEGHDWSDDCQQCKKCGSERTKDHNWVGIKCSSCNKTILYVLGSATNEHFTQTKLDTIYQYGLRNRASVVALLIDALKNSRPDASENSRREASEKSQRRYAAELLVRLNEPSVKKYLPTVILDWLHVAKATRVLEDDGLKSMAASVGMDTEVLCLGAAALGNTYKTDYGSSSGGNFGWSSVGAHDTSSLTRLCQRQDIWSSCLLYRITKKKDVTVTMTTCQPSSYEVKLSFEEEREAARKELVRRGLSDTDPLLRKDLVGNISTRE